MPSRKPSALINWHQAKIDREARESAEAAMTPRTKISRKPPSALKGQPYAAAIWRRLVELYIRIDGTIITAFDTDVLVKYCLAEAELVELSKVREEIKALLNKHIELLNNFKPQPDRLKDYANMLAYTNILLERFQRMDGRLDGKRKMVNEFSQSLFLTPRSRSGVAPREKEPKGPVSNMDKLLAESESAGSPPPQIAY